MATRSVASRLDELEVNVNSIEKLVQTILEKIDKLQEDVSSKFIGTPMTEGADATAIGGNIRNLGGNYDENRFLAPMGRKLEIHALNSKDQEGGALRAESIRSMTLEGSKSDITSFSGNNPDEWILQTEKYFALNGLNNEEQLEVCAGSFEGLALRWFQGENHRRPFRRWEDLKLTILRQFCSSGDRFLTLKQGATMERGITKRNLQKEGENIEKWKEEEDIKKKDRVRGRVELIDNHFEPLLPLTPPYPPLPTLSRPSPPLAVYGVVSSTVDQNKFNKENGDHEFSDKNKNIKRPSKPMTKPNLAISIRPMPTPNLPRYLHCRCLSSSLKPSRSIHEFILTPTKTKPVGEPPPLLLPATGVLESRKTYQLGDVHVNLVVGFINPRMIIVEKSNEQRMFIKDSGAADNSILEELVSKIKLPTKVISEYGIIRKTCVPLTIEWIFSGVRVYLQGIKVVGKFLSIKLEKLYLILAVQWIQTLKQKGTVDKNESRAALVDRISERVCASQFVYNLDPVVRTKMYPNSEKESEVEAWNKEEYGPENVMESESTMKLEGVTRKLMLLIDSGVIRGQKVVFLTENVQYDFIPSVLMEELGLVSKDGWLGDAHPEPPPPPLPPPPAAVVDIMLLYRGFYFFPP